MGWTAIHKTLASAALLALFLPTAVRAERPLTYGEVLEGAVANNPTVGRADLSRVAAEAAVMGANGMFDPALRVNGNYGRTQSRGFFQGFPFKSNSTNWDIGAGLTQTAPTGTTVSAQTSLDRNFSTFTTEFGGLPNTETQQDFYTANANITISQQLLRGLTLSYNMQTVTRAQDTLDIAELTLEKTRQEVLGQAASAYWTWVYQDRLATLAAESVEVAVEAARVGTLRVESGDLAPVERTRLQAAVIQAGQNLMDARIAAQQASDAVLLLIGEEPGQSILPATSVDDVLLLELDPERAVQVAMSQNLDIAVAAAQVERARADQRLAKQGQLPSLSATASAGIGSQQSTAADAVGGIFGDESFPFVNIGGVFEVPLGNRAARASSMRAGVDVLQRELDLEETTRRIRSEVLVQVTGLEAAQRKVGLADFQVRLAQETLDAEEALNEAGRAIQKDVLEARQERDRLTSEAAKARTDWRIAQVDLLRLQGQLSGTNGLF